MAYKRKFERFRLLELLEKDYSAAECARILGVSRAAVNKEMKKMTMNAPKAVAMREAHRFVSVQFNAIDQITASNKNMIWLKDEIKKFMMGEKTVLRKLQRKKLTKWVEKGEDGKKKTKGQEEVETFDFMTDPARLLILIDSEIRQQVQTVAQILQIIGPASEMRATHEALIKYLEANWDADARSKIMEGIKREFGIDPLLQFGGQKMGDNAPGTGGERLPDQESPEAEGGDGVDSPNGPV